jgi:predicted DNA-binding transcriptional regulator AlpA
MKTAAPFTIIVVDHTGQRDVVPSDRLHEMVTTVARIAAREAVAHYIRDAKSVNYRQTASILDSNTAEAGFLRLPDVLKLIPVGKTCWWAGVKSGRFPKSVKLSARCTAWRTDDINRLIASF